MNLNLQLFENFIKMFECNNIFSVVNFGYKLAIMSDENQSNVIIFNQKFILVKTFYWFIEKWANELVKFINLWKTKFFFL